MNDDDIKKVIIIVLSVLHRILAIFAVYGEWINPEMIDAWPFYEHPYCTGIDI